MVLEEKIKNTNFDNTMMDWKSKQKPLIDFWSALIDKSKVIWYYET